MRIDLLIFWILIFLEALRKRILDAFLVRFNLGNPWCVFVWLALVKE